jgi:hypothetical protein
MDRGLLSINHLFLRGVADIQKGGPEYLLGEDAMAIYV